MALKFLQPKTTECTFMAAFFQIPNLGVALAIVAQYYREMSCHLKAHQVCDLCLLEWLTFQLATAAVSLIVVWYVEISKDNVCYKLYPMYQG